MGQMVYRQKNQYLRRCDNPTCKKLSHYIYRIQLGSFTYNFCSGMCADQARMEYESKVKQGITPNNLEPIEEAGESLE